MPTMTYVCVNGASRMPKTGRRVRRVAQGGFTLIEILVALAILGTALSVLLDAHFATLRLHQHVREETIMQTLLLDAVGRAEVEAAAGNLSGSGDFGKRYGGYGYDFDAQSVGEGETPGLYRVLVTVTSPTDSRAMTLYVYAMEER